MATPIKPSFDPPRGVTDEAEVGELYDSHFILAGTRACLLTRNGIVWWYIWRRAHCAACARQASFCRTATSKTDCRTKGPERTVKSKSFDDGIVLIAWVSLALPGEYPAVSQPILLTFIRRYLSGSGVQRPSFSMTSVPTASQYIQEEFASPGLERHLGVHPHLERVHAELC